MLLKTEDCDQNLTDQESDFDGRLRLEEDEGKEGEGGDRGQQEVGLALGRAGSAQQSKWNRHHQNGLLVNVPEKEKLNNWILN